MVAAVEFAVGLVHKKAEDLLAAVEIGLGYMRECLLVDWYDGAGEYDVAVVDAWIGSERMAFVLELRPFEKFL